MLEQLPLLIKSFNKARKKDQGIKKKKKVKEVVASKKKRKGIIDVNEDNVKKAFDVKNSRDMDIYKLNVQMPFKRKKILQHDVE